MAGFNRWSHACCKFLCCVLQLVPHLAKKVWCVQCGSVVWEYVELGVCHWLVGQPFHFISFYLFFVANVCLDFLEHYLWELGSIGFD